jgi:hypothetical protein
VNLAAGPLTRRPNLQPVADPDIRVRRVAIARTLDSMFVVVAIVAGLMVWFGATLLVDAWQGSRLDLAARLGSHRLSVADEAQRWLDQVGS